MRATDTVWYYHRNRSLNVGNSSAAFPSAVRPEKCTAALGTMNGRTMNAAQDRRPEPDFCYLLRGNITPESQYCNLTPISHEEMFDYRDNAAETVTKVFAIIMLGFISLMCAWYLFTWFIELNC